MNNTMPKTGKALLLSALAALLLTGCGNTSTVDEIAAQYSSESAETPSADPEKFKSENAYNSSGYDVDLTNMSSSVVYATVYDMVYTSDNYVGKTVKVRGPFSYFQDPQTGNEYFAVLVNDATACCSQGIEFVLDGDYSYPDDYPEINTEITIAGKFNYYKEGYNTYVQLQNAHILES